MITELNHLGMVVRDLDASLAFYEGSFGARVVFRGVITSSATDVVYVQIGQSLIELLHPADPSPDETFGITHIAFISDDLDEDFTSVTGAGIRALAAPKPAGTGIGRLAFVESPAGARVELIQRDLELRGSQLVPSDVTPKVSFALEVPDVEAEVAFFRDLLGMVVRAPESGPSSGSGSVRLGMGDDVLTVTHGLGGLLIVTNQTE